MEAPSPQSWFYRFRSWSDGGARIHTIVTPAAATTYTIVTPAAATTYTAIFGVGFG